MSGYEDEDFDDDLPCVSLSQSTGGKSELEMPPASQLASLRAREDAAERALQEHENNDPLLISLSRSTSQSSTSEEGEAALSAAVSALQVTEAQPGTRGMCADRLQLLTSMKEHFPEDKFLDSYIQMMRNKPQVVDSVTEQILQSISSALISGRSSNIPTTAAWLLCTALSTPRALRVRRVLHAILDVHASDEHVRALAVAVSVAIEDPEQLLSAYDAVRTGARRGADQLAATLLAHAMARVLNQKEQNPPSPLSTETVNLVRVSWRKLPTRAQLTLLRCAGRALAAGEMWAKDEGDKGGEGDTGVKEDTGVKGDTGDMGDTGVKGDKGDKGDMVDTRIQGDTGVKRDTGDKGDTGDNGDKGDIVDTRVRGDTGDKGHKGDTDAGDKMDTDVTGIDTGVDTKENLNTKNTNGIQNVIKTSAIDNTEDRTEQSKEREGGAALLAALAQPLPRASAFDMNRQQVLTNVSKLQLLFRERFIRGVQEIEEIPLNCSQNSLESTTEATPTKTVEMKIKIPMKMVTPMKLTYPLLAAKKETKDERIKKTVKGQLKLDGFFKQGTQVNVQEDRSPEPKRPKRQCSQRNGK